MSDTSLLFFFIGLSIGLYILNRGHGNQEEPCELHEWITESVTPDGSEPYERMVCKRCRFSP